MSGLQKALIHVNLGGLNEKVSSQLTDQSAVLSVCENVEFLQDLSPTTRTGYVEASLASGLSNTYTRTCSITDGAEYIVTTDEVRKVFFRTTGAVITNVSNIKPLLLTPLTRGGLARCQATRIAAVAARMAQSRNGAGGLNDASSSADALTISDAYWYKSLSGTTNGAVVIAVSPVYASGKTSTDTVPVCTLYLVDASTGAIIDTVVADDLYVDNSSYQAPTVMKLTGFQDNVVVAIAGHDLGNTATIKFLTYTFTKDGFTGYNTATRTDYYYAGTPGLDGLLTSYRDDTQGLYSGGTYRCGFLYHSTGDGNDTGTVRRAAMASNGTVTSSLVSSGLCSGIAVFSTCAFGYWYVPVNDEHVFVYCDVNSGVTYVRCTDSGGSSFVGRHGGGFASEISWTSFTPVEGCIIHLSRVTMYPLDDDANVTASGTTLKCYGMVAAYSLVPSGLGSNAVVLRFAQAGSASITAPKQKIEFAGGANYAATPTEHIPAAYLVASPFSPTNASNHYTLVPVVKQLDYNAAPRNQGLLYRVDGACNTPQLTGGAYVRMTQTCSPPKGASFPVAGTFATGTGQFVRTFSLAVNGASYNLPSACVDKSATPGESFLVAPTCDGTNFVISSGSKSPQAYSLYRIDHTPAGFSSCRNDAGTFVSDGYLINSDGGQFIEATHVEEPQIAAVTTTGAGATITLPCTYGVMYEYETLSGALMWSGLSTLLVGSSPATCTSATVKLLAPTQKQARPFRQIKAHVFRNENNGYRYVGTIDFNDSTYWSTPAYAQLIDTTSTGTTLSAQVQPYYDPEKVGGGTPLPRQPSASLRSITNHKDRLFGIDEHGDVRFTGPYVAGEFPWWSDAFKLSVPGNGRAVALASFGGRLFVFKTDSVYVIDGDGPPQNGGNGSEFSQPQKLSGCLGCQDPRSVLETPMGVFFRSQRGFELISSNGAVEFVGEFIQNTADAYPTTVAAAYDPDADSMKFLVSSITEPVNGYVAGTAGGAILCLYGKSGRWSVHKVSVDSVADSNFSDMKIADLGDRRATVLSSADGRIFVERRQSVYDSTRYLDPTGSPVAWKLATSWIRAGATNTRFVVYKTEVFGLNQSNHKLVTKLYSNYSDSSPKTDTFEPPYTQAAPEIIVSEPDVIQLYAVKYEVSCAAPTDTGTYPVTTGEGCRPLQISLTIGVQDGNPLVPAVQRK